MDRLLPDHEGCRAPMDLLPTAVMVAKQQIAGTSRDTGTNGQFFLWMWTWRPLTLRPTTLHLDYAVPVTVKRHRVRLQCL
jgi:hypothetical protein